MGKRGKSSVQTSESKNKKKKLEECDATESVLICTDSNTKTKKQKSQKKIKIKNVTEEKVQLEETDTLAVELDTAANKKIKKASVSADKKSVKNKKVLFIDDTPIEVSNQTSIEKKKETPDLAQEDDVKDEDIDKFCEEIDEEDNLQYLNWVEQIEAKLNSNKKKPK